MKLTKQEVLQDVLCATKYLMQMCTKNQIEGSTPNLRHLFEDLYKTASEQNFKIFQTMQDYDFYKTMKAEENQIQTTLDCHEKMQKNLEEKLN